jgi:hypothetical protein
MARFPDRIEQSLSLVFGQPRAAGQRLKTQFEFPALDLQPAQQVAEVFARCSNFSEKYRDWVGDVVDR